MVSKPWIDEKEVREEERKRGREEERKRGREERKMD